MQTQTERQKLSGVGQTVWSQFCIWLSDFRVPMILERRASSHLLHMPNAKVCTGSPPHSPRNIAVNSQMLKPAKKYRILGLVLGDFWCKVNAKTNKPFRGQNLCPSLRLPLHALGRPATNSCFSPQFWAS